MRRLVILAVVVTVLLEWSVVQAKLIDAVSIGYGKGQKESLLTYVYGFRVAIQKDWNKRFLASSHWHWTGLWDINFSQWRASPDWNGRYRDVSFIAINPIIRLRPDDPFSFGMVPYLEGSVGFSLADIDHCGGHIFGSRFNFEDILGIGSYFGSHQQFDFTFRVLHFSNAGMGFPNAGMTVHYFGNFAYHFAS